MGSNFMILKEIEARDNEESSLISDSHHSTYGSTQGQRSRLSAPSLNQLPDDPYSDHGGSSEEFSSAKLAKRKKKRLQKHHKNRPKLVSKLSHIVRSAAQSEEEEDNTDDVIQISPDDLILPELDQKYDKNGLFNCTN